MTMFLHWNAGALVCGHQDGIHQEIFLPCSISRHLCSGSSSMDWLWAKMHTLLAPFTHMVSTFSLTWVHHRPMALGLLHEYSQEGAAQGWQEERPVVPWIKILAICSTSPVTILMATLEGVGCYLPFEFVWLCLSISIYFKLNSCISLLQTRWHVMLKITPSSSILVDPKTNQWGKDIMDSMAVHSMLQHCSLMFELSLQVYSAPP